MAVLTEDDLEGVDEADPDIELVRFGGHVSYGKKGEVLSVRSLTGSRTSHMMRFGEPESLKAEDVDRCAKIESDRRVNKLCYHVIYYYY